MRYRSIVHRARKAASLAACVLAAQVAAQTGPTSPLYLSTGTQIAVLEGFSVVDSWATGGEQEYSIAVNTTVRTWSQGNPFLDPFGREYQLDGTPTGTTFVNGVGCCFRDGTTDGQFNYAVRVTTPVSLVYRFSLDWTDPQVMPFPTQFTSAVTGIAYDSSDDTFWLSGGNAFFSITHIRRTGQFISFIPGGAGGNTSVAYDQADDTLWVYTWAPQTSELVQFATSDDLSSPNTPLFRQPGIGAVTGIEFQFQQALAPVPEPGTAMLLGAGLTALWSVRPRRRRHCTSGKL